MIVFRLVGGEGDTGYQPSVWPLPQWPRWIASVVTHTLPNKHIHTVGWTDMLADPYIMCLCVKELLFIVSPHAYSLGAGMSHTSLFLSHYFFVFLPPSISFLVSIYLILSLSLSHPFYISTHWENKEDIASYLFCVCLPVCVWNLWSAMLDSSHKASFSSDTDITCY